MVTTSLTKNAQQGSRASLRLQLGPTSPKVQALGHQTSSVSRVPQRGVLVLPGLGNNSKDYFPIVESLRKRALKAEVAQVTRADWLRNASGLLDANYWRGTLNPRPTVDWYLKRVDAALKQVADQTEGGPVALIGHSAGGWLARLYLLGFGSQGIIDKLITLGSPHLPPPEGSKVIDQTRGILAHVQRTCPGRFHEDIQYISVAGRYVKGALFSDKGSTWKEKIVGLGYQQVCGKADVWGDGVVPEDSAHLPGALQITLEDVYHSPVGSAQRKGSRTGRNWYGSDSVLEQWIPYLVEEADGPQEGVVSVENIVEEAVL